jgi:hypothetical protein
MRRLVVIPCLLALAGCGSGGIERDAAAVSERFHSALAERDGTVACEQLTEQARTKLEQDEKKPCEEAIFTLDLPESGEVADTSVHITSASVRLAGGERDFLDKGPEGWRISDAGCKPTPNDQPYDCELEG